MYSLAASQALRSWTNATQEAYRRGMPDARDIDRSAHPGFWTVRRLIRLSLFLLLFSAIGCSPTVEDVRNTSDQEVLADIARKAQSIGVISAAVEKITDQTLLADLARNAEKDFARAEAVKKLADQALLAEIAMENRAYWARIYASQRLTDKAMLARVARRI